MKLSEKSIKRINTLVTLIIGVLITIISDKFGDFSGASEYRDSAIKNKDYAQSIDSLYKSSKEKERLIKQKETAAFITIKKMIARDQELTIKAIEELEDSVFSVKAFDRDSIRSLLIKE